MRPLFLALAAPLALTLSTPLSAAADLTTQTEATLSCSDNHSVVMSLDQTALTNLLGDVQAINLSGLMTCDVATNSSNQTADWTVYDYNPSGHALAPRHSPDSLPATTSGTTTTFPFKTGVYTALLTTNDGSLTGDLSAKTLTDTVSVSGDAASFMTQHNGGDCVSNVPAAVRFYFTAPSASGPSTGTPPAGFYTHFWWSNPVNSELLVGTQSQTIMASMSDPNQWSDWNGQQGSNPAVTEAFIEATHKVQSIGLSFGGLCFFETGVTPTGAFTNEQFSSDFGES
jgi:hypothetical protein